MVVPSYAFRLVRRFGTRRVGWFIVAVFVSLAMMHWLGPSKSAGAGWHSAISLDLLYAVGSVLLLVGMGHIETLTIERDRACQTEQELRKEWETRKQDETAELASAREQLAYELACQEERVKELEESQARYRLLFLENPQPMWVLDLRSCRFLEINDAALRQYGFTYEEVMALSGRDLVLPSAVTQFLQDLAKPCPAAEERGIWQHCRKDGTLIEVEVTAVDLNYAGTQARLIVANDVSRRRRREMKLRKTQRMEVISQIAGGVAQHLNGIFAAIQSDTSTLGARTVDVCAAEHVEQINAAVMRAAGLTRQLLAAGGRQPMRAEPLDLNGLIRNLNPMLARLAGELVTLENACAGHLPPVTADRRLIENVVVDMVLNAREAMPAGGTLTLSTAKVHIEDDQAANDPQVRAGDFVCLEVRDTGCGMTPQEQTRLFEPFFSTKEADTRMGLGLAGVYGVMSQHSGWIDCSSEPGVGTEFRVFLPCAAAAFSVPDTDTRSIARVIKGTILLVEPDDRGRALARFVLDRHGYRVIEADTSTTALVLWQGQGPTVDLLLTSLAMPDGTSGRDLAGQLRQTRPGLRVIYASDAAPNGVEDPTNHGENSVSIAKPYNPARLVEVVKGSLQG